MSDVSKASESEAEPIDGSVDGQEIRLEEAEVKTNQAPALGAYRPFKPLLQPASPAACG